ncbi:MAG: glycoside hydrolase family 65 protein [Nitrososphaerales archaeon]
MSVWSLRYKNYNPTTERLRETLCTVGNGYFATRGAAPESKADRTHYPGTYIAGCYNRLESEIDGRKIENESLVNVPNWLPLAFRVGKGKWFDLRHKKILNFEQELDVRRGILTRKVRFQDGRGRITNLIQRRFVHMEYPHLAGLQTTLVAENWSGRVKFLSALDGRVTNSGVAVYRPFNGSHLVSDKQSVSQDTTTIYLSVRTSQSNIRIAEAARTTVLRDGKEVRALKKRAIVKPRYVGQEFSVILEKGKSVSVEKVVALYTSKDLAISECGYAAMREVSNAPSFDELVRRHVLSWDHLWRRFRIRVVGDDRAALTVHIHIFHLLQTASVNSINVDVSIPARGLHGEAYRGHVFWDELFIFPLFNSHIPDLTRSLLMYRYRRLPEAKLAALKAGFKGALYPWQSGSDGREETQVINLNPLSNRWMRDNTHLQWHVNAAIVHNVWNYYQVSHDIDFLVFYGAQIITEIARFFGSVARYNKSIERYEIHGVIGPDEFHDGYPGSKKPGLNNNAYTNIMTVWVLCRALEVLKLIPKSRREALLDNLDLKEEELVRWEDISRKMFVPFHNGVISQFEGYEKLREFDWEGYKKKYKNIQRLDRILESEGDTANNYKVSKQADVLMLFYLFSSGELGELFARLGYRFEDETIPKNIEYYVKRTSHGSTLSRVVHSWILARLNREESWQIAKEALESDLSDIQGGTTAEGIHIGAMAGTVEIIQSCYMGLVTRNDILWLDPCLPKEIKKILFTILYRGHTFELKASPSMFEITSSPGPAGLIKVGFQETVFEVKPGESMKFTLQSRNQVNYGLSGAHAQIIQKEHAV